ncbi:MAG: hypothetical protein JSW06_02845 [Thermoplasmatales archaeon]|nr:MAG: hypothetical protein JSW06_02845 [Thermoplasmatales archaeon]
MIKELFLKELDKAKDSDEILEAVIKYKKREEKRKFKELLASDPKREDKCSKKTYT